MASKIARTVRWVSRRRDSSIAKSAEPPQNRARTRVLLVDAERRVIAASDRRGLLTETIALDVRGRTSGYYRDQSGTVTAFHHTPGYETYRGLGWYGVILQGAADAR